MVQEQITNGGYAAHTDVDRKFPMSINHLPPRPADSIVLT